MEKFNLEDAAETTDYTDATDGEEGGQMDLSIQRLRVCQSFHP
jgi:hypothetical protein